MLLQDAFKTYKGNSQSTDIEVSQTQKPTGDMRARMTLTRKESMVLTHLVPSTRANAFDATRELTYRYCLNLWLNPGILGTRLVMYIILSLLVGALFFDLESNDTYSSANSRLAVLFYCNAFFIFMSVAVLPFTVMERAIIDKEVRNGYYHPACFQIAQAIASIPGTFVIALMVSVITLGMTGMRSPYWYFLIMFLSLNCAEALAHLVSHIVPHFIIGIAVVAATYGMMMLLNGYFIIPSEFPGWLSWTYYISIHTYSWRSFMYGEFHGNDTTFNSKEFPTGESILELYEIEDVSRTNDMIVLLCYALGVHCLSLLVLHLNYLRNKNHQAA